jgi:hypothetical protein
MKTILSFLLIIFCYSLNAQDATWFETGSSWKYHYEDNPDIIVDPTVISIAEYTISEQTTLNGQACAKMEAMGDDPNPLGCNAISAPIYLYESNDSIFFANDYDPTFRLAYDFGAEVGDSWEYAFPVEMADTVVEYNVTVADVSSINIDGQDLKQMTLDYEGVNEEGAIFQSIVTEKFGAQKFLLFSFNQLFICESPFNVELQCYNDSQIAYINPDYNSCVVGLEEPTLNADFQIYPNPTAGDFTIENAQLHNGNVQLFSATGKLVYSSRIKNNRKRIDTATLLPGLYMLSIQTEKGNALKKIVVE